MCVGRPSTPIWRMCSPAPWEPTGAILLAEVEHLRSSRYLIKYHGVREYQGLLYYQCDKIGMRREIAIPLHAACLTRHPISPSAHSSVFSHRSFDKYIVSRLPFKLVSIG